MGLRLFYFIWSLLTTLFSSLFYVIRRRWRQLNPYYDARLPHHTRYGFKNVPHSLHPGRMAIIKWSVCKWFRKKQPVAADLLAAHQLSEAQKKLLAEPATSLQATWLGHSTMLVQQEGFNYLTDPIFSERASISRFFGPKRLQPPALDISQLPRIDAVLISHDHYDHLDLSSVKELYYRPEKPHFYVPLGLEAWFKKHISYGNTERIHALEWWESRSVTGNNQSKQKVFLVPSQHWSKRHLLGSNQSLWGGFIVQTERLTTYFAGDTAYSPICFKQIGDMFGPIDLALIPVGGYEPRAFMKFHHVNEMEAVKIFKDVQAQHGVAIHWGTFQLTDEAPDAPRQILPQMVREAGLPEDRFRLLHHGDTVNYSR